MNLNVLRYCQYDKIKPVYHLAEGDKFLLTARIDQEAPQSGSYSGGAFNSHNHGGAGGTAGQVLVNVGAPAWQNQKPSRENGLYFLKVVMNKKPMWQYVYKGYHKKGYQYYEIDFETRMLNEKGLTGVIENKIFYKSMKEEQVKGYLVLYE